MLYCENSGVNSDGVKYIFKLIFKLINSILQSIYSVIVLIGVVHTTISTKNRTQGQRLSTLSHITNPTNVMTNIVNIQSTNQYLLIIYIYISIYIYVYAIYCMY